MTHAVFHRAGFRLFARGLAVLALGAAALPATAAPIEGKLFLPGENVANPDGALSISNNPAGLAEPAGVDGRLQFNAGGVKVGASRGTGWGTFLSVPLGALGIGASLEHAEDRLKSGQDPEWYARSRLSLGAGLALGERVRIGATTTWHALEGGGDLNSWDLGLLLRPARWFSLGVRASGLHDATGSTADVLTTHWTWGLALRPLGNDRLTAAADVDWPAGGNIGTFRGSISGRIINGVTLLLEHLDFKPVGATSSDALHDRRTTLMVRLGFGRVGADIAVHSDSNTIGDDNGGLAGGIRFSSDAPHSMFKAGDAAVSFKLSGTPEEHDGGKGQHFSRLLLEMERIGRTPGTNLVVLRADDFDPDWAQTEELRAAVTHLRHSGKHVVWYAAQITTRGLVLASACDRIVMPPSGAMTAHGIGADFIGLHDTLAKLGIAVQALRYGAYKTAPESLTQQEPSRALHEQIEHTIERRWQTVTTAVALGREVTAGALEDALQDGAVFPEDALAAHLIDAVANEERLEPQLREWGVLGASDSLRKWSLPPVRRSQWGVQPRVTVVEIDGTIADHKGGSSLMGRTIGGDDMVETIKQASDDSATKAIVARIHSPGGTVVGSERMYEALLKAGKKKPVLASMGAVAASGGYWTALGATTIFADRETVTGSVGIFALKPSLGGLWEKIGLGIHHFGIGPHDDVTSLNRPWTEAEEEVLHRTLGRYYGLFLDRVAQRRKIDRASLPLLAEGRIWFGDEALTHHMVDRVGGLLDALAEARRVARLDDPEDVKVRFLPRPTLLEQLRASIGVSVMSDVLQPADAAWMQALRTAAGPWLDAAQLQDLGATGQPLALLPVRVDAP